MLERSARTIVMRRNLSKLQRFCTWMLCAFVGQRIRISGRVGWGYDGYRYSTLQGLEIPLDRVRFNICCFLLILKSKWHLGKLLTLAVTNSWPIRQLDVNNAFLQGSLTDEVFMEQPPGFEDFFTPDYVCKLHKPIYGLRQAPRAWYNELRTFLVSEGFSISHSSLFILHSPSSVIYILVYVDDIIITGSAAAEVNAFISTLAKRFSIKPAFLFPWS